MQLTSCHRNLRQVIGRDEMSIHPIAAAQVDKALLERMRAARAEGYAG